MRHNKKKGMQMNMQRDHAAAMLRGLATSVILFEKIKTTEGRAKRVQPLVEKLITYSKGENKMNAIRLISRVVLDKNAGKKLMEVLNERYKERNGGYTRITKLGFRPGDKAPYVQIQLV